jgi:aryl-alcohol dehydrogenase-like predicted oxidoreductase
MYNRSEKVVGGILAGSDLRDRLFLATKVWIDGKAAGEQQMADSARLMNTDVIDLMQVHNLRDLATHMETIRDWQAQKKIRYSGITHYTSSALQSLEQAMKAQRPDFIQINYSLGERDAGKRVLPLAADMGIAIIVNRPFVAGRLFSAVGDSALPDWATPFAASWGQFLLKFIIADAAVTCVIPATSNVNHMVDNVAAGFGPLPDARERERMIQFFATL